MLMVMMEHLGRICFQTKADDRPTAAQPPLGAALEQRLHIPVGFGSAHLGCQIVVLNHSYLNQEVIIHQHRYFAFLVMTLMALDFALNLPLAETAYSSILPSLWSC